VFVKVPVIKLIVTSRQPIALPPSCPLMLVEHDVGAMSEASALRLVRSCCKDLSDVEAVAVADACRRVPLLLRLASEAITAGRVLVPVSLGGGGGEWQVV
jgi:hypothetical protein